MRLGNMATFIDLGALKGNGGLRMRPECGDPDQEMPSHLPP